MERSPGMQSQRDEEGDTVLQKNQTDTKFGETKYSGPYTIVNVYGNGMVLINKGIVTRVVNTSLYYITIVVNTSSYYIPIV
jgi:hypothetical protein